MISFASGRAFAQGIELVGWVLIARHLATSEFGQLMVAFLACRYLGIVGDWGGAVRGPRDVAAASSAVSSLLSMRVRASLGLGLAYAVACVLFGHWPLACLGLVVVGRGIARDWVALGRERGIRASLPGVMQGVGVLAVGLVRVPFVGYYAAGVGCAYFGACLLSMALNRLAPTTTAAKARSGFPWLIMLGVADQVSASGDVFLLAALTSTAVAGVYSAVYRIPNAWISVIGMLASASIPLSLRQLKGGPATARMVWNRLAIGAAAGSVLLLLTPLLTRSVVTLFGSAYASGAGPLGILLIATAAITVSVPLQPLLVAQARDRYLAAVTAAGMVVNVATNLALIPFYGAMGAATATLASQVLVSVLVIAAAVPRRRRLRAGAAC
jgi:O-antigen/teichoic acid export membrane protein